MSAKSTNAKLADLISKQTYDERMSMAALLRDSFADWLTDEANTGEKPSLDEIAWWLKGIADEFYEASE